MQLSELKNHLPDFAKDIRLNLSSVLSEEGAPGLIEKQIYSIALASAYATKNEKLIQAIEDEAKTVLLDDESHAAKASATIMAMNNIYYRFVHSVSEDAIKTLPVSLRMNVMANPGVEKRDFELMSLAVSSINGCAYCMESHTQLLLKSGISKQGVQSAIRIAAVVSAAAQVLSIV